MRHLFISWHHSHTHIHTEGNLLQPDQLLPCFWKINRGLMLIQRGYINCVYMWTYVESRFLLWSINCKGYIDIGHISSSIYQQLTFACQLHFCPPLEAEVTCKVFFRHIQYLMNGFLSGMKNKFLCSFLAPAMLLKKHGHCYASDSDQKAIY